MIVKVISSYKLTNGSYNVTFEPQDERIRHLTAHYVDIVCEPSEIESKILEAAPAASAGMAAALNSYFVSNTYEPDPNAGTAPIWDVTPRQIRQALVLNNVTMAQIESALDALPEPTKSLAKIEWEYSTAFVRSNPLVAQVGVALGWTSQQLDNLWRFAKTL